MGVDSTKSGISVAIIDTPKTCSDCPFLCGTFCALTDELFYSYQDGWSVAIDYERYEHCTLTDF